MKLRFNSEGNNLILNNNQTFRTDLGWEESFQVYEDEILESIINPIENYETNRYIHKPYVSSNGIDQTDIWFHFYFINESGNYTLDYKSVGISQTNKLLSDLKNSFFRLEFYKTPNNEPPNRSNRRLVFGKNLSAPVGERVLITGKLEKLYVPVFVGSSIRNKENMYLFWFHDDTVLEETTLTGTTFYMTTKFYNPVDGSKIQFANKQVSDSTTFVEEDDMYFLVEMNRDDAPTYHYEVRDYDSTGTVRGNRRGESSDPIKFYEIGGNAGSGNTPTPTPSSTTVLTPTPTPSSTVVLTPTPSTTTTTLSWSNGSSMNHSEVLPGDNPSTGTTTGTLTVTNGPANLYITVTHQTGFDNIGYGSISVNGVGSISTQTVSGNQSSTSLPSTLTVPTGTYTYTITSILTISGSNSFGVISTSVSNQ